MDFLPTWLELAGALRCALSAALCMSCALQTWVLLPGLHAGDLAAGGESARCWRAAAGKLRPLAAPRLARRTAAGVSDPYAEERDGKSFAKAFQSPLLENPDDFRIGAMAENVVTRQGST